MQSRRYVARAERIQQRREAGSVADRYPEVAAIVISMSYTQMGITSILRTFNFSPSSYAFFRVECLSEDCVDGGFDLTQVITAMISNRRAVARGELSCAGSDPFPDHSTIAYQVAIQYS